MCSGAPSAPKQYQPSAPVNGTWTPVKAYTAQEEAAILAAAKQEDRADREAFLAKDRVQRTVDGAATPEPNGFDIQLATMRARQRINDRAGQGAADAQELARRGSQAPKQAQAPGSRVGATGGSTSAPGSLITGGTTAAALTTRNKPAATLLGG